MDYGSFVALAGRDPRGLTLLANLVDAVAEKLVDSEVAANLPSAALDLFTKQVSGGREVVADHAFQCLQSVARTGPLALAQGKNRTIATAPMSIFHVTTFENVKAYHFPPRSADERQDIRSRNRIAGCTNGDRAASEEEYVARIREGKVPPGKAFGIPGGALWLGAELGRRSMELATAGADVLRDLLGLVHIDDANTLVRYRLEVDDRIAVRPTPLDGAGTRFRQIADDSSAFLPWGTTVNLAAFRSAKRVIDGVHECVLASIELVQEPQFVEHLRKGIEYIGIVSEDTRKDRTASMERSFANRILRGRSSELIVATIAGWRTP